MAIEINNYLCFKNYYKTQKKVYKNAVVATKLFNTFYPPMPRGSTAQALLHNSFNKSAPLSTVATTQFIAVYKQCVLYLLVSFKNNIIINRYKFVFIKISIYLIMVYFLLFQNEISVQFELCILSRLISNAFFKFRKCIHPTL